MGGTWWRPSEEEIANIVLRYNAGESTIGIGADLGKGKTQISRILQGRVKIRSTSESILLWHKQENHSGRIFNGEHRVLIRRPGHPKALNNYVTEHLLVWEENHPDDPVKKGEIIHHIDGNWKNNSISNLIKMTIAEHRRHKPRNIKVSGRRQIVGQIGEDLVGYYLDFKFSPIDVGADGIIQDVSAEIKTRTKNKYGWQFHLDRDARIYVLVALNTNLSVFGIWVMPRCMWADNQKVVYIGDNDKYIGYRLL